MPSVRKTDEHSQCDYSLNSEEYVIILWIQLLYHWELHNDSKYLDESQQVI